MIPVDSKVELTRFPRILNELLRLVKLDPELLGGPLDPPLG